MLIIFLLLFIFTFVAAAISKYDVYNLRIDNSLMFTSPNAEFWFGTDNMGRDYWSQVWHATRTSIILAVSVSFGQIFVGVVIGLVWGYVRKLDRFFTELYNLIDNIPVIIYMTLIALMLGKTTLIMGVAMIGFGWLATARNVRNLVFMYRDREYNLASRCLGTSLWRILYRNILPYMVSVIILRLALAIPGTIAYETTLTYLGLMDISTPSLGILLRNARSYFLDYPYLLRNVLNRSSPMSRFWPQRTWRFSLSCVGKSSLPSASAPWSYMMVKRWPSWVSPVPARACLRSALWVCWIKTGPLPMAPSCIRART